MNINKVEKQLKKINALIQNIKGDELISAIEKELLLSYIRKLYEKTLQINTTGSSSKPAISIPSIPKHVTPKIPVQISEVVMQEVKEASFVPQKENTPTSVIVEKKETPIAIATMSLKKTIDPKLLELFAPESIIELSDRLNQSAISDLTKCMGINEKIFTTTELFDGNTGLFAASMKKLNDFTSIEQARDFLVEQIAVDNDWTNEKKSKKAIKFIKLISRRYK